MTWLLLLVGGMATLIVGAEALVKGASRLAAALGISPLVIGLTVVAFGTSSPELAVSLGSSVSGQGDLALGNVIGSNIFNVLFILGLSALITPLVVAQQLVRLDVPLMVLVSVLCLILGMDGRIGRLDGLVLATGLAVYTVFLTYQSRKEKPEIHEEYAKNQGQSRRKSGSWIWNLILVFAGLGLLVLGSRWLVGGAVSIAERLGVSRLIIGLTLVAAGTSLPEVATSVLASIRGERDIAVGNVVGSNLFNLLGVLGLSGLVAPDGVSVTPAALQFDLPVMIAVALACLPIFFTENRIARWEGTLFLGYYAAYTTYLVLGATQHDALPTFSKVMMVFVVPLTVLTLMIVTWRAMRHKTPAAAGGRA